MTPEQERFAELATRSLEATPELREDARAEVLGRLAHTGADSAGASDRLETSRPRSFWVLPCFAAIALLVLGLAASWQVNQALPEARTLQGLMSFAGPLGSKDRLREQLDPEARDFVYACIGSDQEVVKNLQRQWELHPDELGIYEQLVHRRIVTKQGLPPDFAQTWRRLDADNGLWLFLEAVGKNEEWKAKGPPAGETYSREVLDLLCRSASAPSFKSYLPELRTRRLAMLGPSDTLAEEADVILYSISALWAPSVRHQLEALQTFGKAAKQAAVDKDAAKLVTVLNAYERLPGRLAANGSTLLDIIPAASTWSEADKVMLPACVDLDLGEEELRMDELGKEFANYRAAFHGSSADPRRMGSLARALVIGPVPDVVVEVSDFEPGRRVEYAVTERMSASVAAIVTLLFLAVAGVESFRRGPCVNGLAAGLEPLFRPVDLLWILSLGIAVPALWYIGITRWTPFGMRDLGMTHYNPYPILIQEGTALVFALLMIVQTARWRVSARVGFLSLKPARPWIGWAMTGLAALVMLLAGGVRWLSGNEQRYLQAIAATGGLPLLWLLWEIGMVVFSPRNHALGGVLLCRRMILPFAMVAALLLASWVPLSATERHWHSLDQITRGDREHGGLTMLESRAIGKVRERFRKAFPEAGDIR